MSTTTTNNSSNGTRFSGIPRDWKSRASSSGLVSQLLASSVDPNNTEEATKRFADRVSTAAFLREWMAIYTGPLAGKAGSDFLEMANLILFLDLKESCRNLNLPDEILRKFQFKPKTEPRNFLRTQELDEELSPLVFGPELVGLKANEFPDLFQSHSAAGKKCNYLPRHKFIAPIVTKGDLPFIQECNEKIYDALEAEVEEYPLSIFDLSNIQSQGELDALMVNGKGWEGVNELIVNGKRGGFYGFDSPASSPKAFHSFIVGGMYLLIRKRKGIRNEAYHANSIAGRFETFALQASEEGATYEDLYCTVLDKNPGLFIWFFTILFEKIIVKAFPSFKDETRKKLAFWDKYVTSRTFMSGRICNHVIDGIAKMTADRTFMRQRLIFFPRDVRRNSRRIDRVTLCEFKYGRHQFGLSPRFFPDYDPDYESGASDEESDEETLPSN